MSSPKRQKLVVVAAASIAVAGAVMLVSCVQILALALSGSTFVETPFALIGAIVFPIPGIGMLVLEYFAVCRWSREASRAIAAVFVFFSLLGCLCLLLGLLRLVGGTSHGDPFVEWLGLEVFFCFVAYCTFVGVAHWRWARFLRREQKEGVGSKERTVA